MTRSMPTRGLTIALVTTAYGCLAAGALGGEPPGRAVERVPLFVSAGELEWKRAEQPPGASEALLGLSHHLVRWPAGAVLNPHTRRTTWYGVVLQGTLTLRTPGTTNSLAPLSYFRVQSGVTVSASCATTSMGNCVFVGAFSTAASIGDWVGANSLTSGAPEEFDHLLIDLSAAEWRRAAPGVAVGVMPRGTGADRAVLIGMNAYWIYKLGRDARLPVAPGGTGVFMGFVLAGRVLGDSGAERKTLGPGSFFKTSERAPIVIQCQEAECMVITTEETVQPAE